MTASGAGSLAFGIGGPAQAMSLNHPLSVSPASTTAGSYITISGTGCSSQTEYTVGVSLGIRNLNTEAVNYAFVNHSDLANGSWSKQIRMPSPAGQYEVSANCDQYTESFMYTPMDVTSTPAVQTVTPNPVGPGKSITVRGANCVTKDAGDYATGISVALLDKDSNIVASTLIPPAAVLQGAWSTPLTVPQTLGLYRVASTCGFYYNSFSYADVVVKVANITKLTLTAPASVLAGGTAILSGQLTGGDMAGRPVVLGISAAGAAKRNVTVTTNSSGVYKYALKVTRNTTVQASYAPTATQSSATSVARKIAAQEIVGITSPKAGARTAVRTVAVTGTVSPVANGTIVTLWERTRNGNVRLLNAREAANGTFRFGRTWARGTHTIFVTVAATKLNAAGTSKLISFTIT